MAISIAEVSESPYPLPENDTERLLRERKELQQRLAQAVLELTESTAQHSACIINIIQDKQSGNHNLREELQVALAGAVMRVSAATKAYNQYVQFVMQNNGAIREAGIDMSVYRHKLQLPMDDERV